MRFKIDFALKHSMWRSLGRKGSRQVFLLARQIRQPRLRPQDGLRLDDRSAHWQKRPSQFPILQSRRRNRLQLRLG